MTSTRRRLALAAVGAVGCAAACAQIAGLRGDYVLGAADASDTGVVPEAGDDAGDDVVDDGGGTEADAPLAADDCADAGVYLCDGFEQGLAPSLWEGAPPNANVTLSVDSTRAHRGRFSLRLHADPVDASPTGGAIGHKAPLPSPDVYARLFLYVPAQDPHVVNLVYVAPSDGGSDEFLALDGTQLQLVFNPPFMAQTAVKSVGAGKWVCAEWHVHGGNAEVGELDVSQDGVKVATLAGLPTNLSFGVFALEFQTYDTIANPIDYWIDDLYVDTKPVGCVK